MKKKILVIIGLMFCISCTTTDNTVYEVMMKDGTIYHIKGYDSGVITSRGCGASYIVYSTSGKSMFNVDKVVYIRTK